MIKTLSYANVKGKTAAHELAPITVFIGQNAVGKTAALDALDLAILKYHPKHGAQGSNIFKKLASGPYLQVNVDTTKGKVFYKLEKKGQGISKEEGAECEFQPIMRDHTLYTSLSHDARIKLVASLVKLSDAESFSVPQILASVKNIRLEKNTEASEAAILAQYKILSEQPIAAPLDWLGKLIKLVSDSLSYAVKARKIMTAVNIGITALQEQDAEQTVQGNAVETKLKTARKELGLLQEAAGEIAFKVNEAKKAVLRRNELLDVKKPDVDEVALTAELTLCTNAMRAAKRLATDRVLSTSQLASTLEKLKYHLESTLSELAKLRVKKTALESVSAPQGSKDLEKERYELEAQIAVQQVAVAAREQLTLELAKRVSGMEVEKGAILASYKLLKVQVDALEAEKVKFLSHSKCPTCLTSGEEWKEAWTIAQDTKIADKKKNLQGVLDEGQRLKADILLQTEILKKQEAEDLNLEVLKTSLNAKKEELAKLNQALTNYNAAQLNLAELKAEEGKLEALIEPLNKQIAEANAAHQSAFDQDKRLEELEIKRDALQSRINEAAELLKAWSAAQSELAMIGDVDLPRAQAIHARQQGLVEAKQLEISGLEEQKKAVELQRADLKRQTDAVLAAEKAQAEVDVLKAVKELLETKQAELVNKAFKALLVVVNKFSSAVISHELVYHNGEMGYFNKGQFVSADSFSGAEELVTFVGLCIALAAGADQKIVVIDEMTRLIGSMKDKVVKRMIELVQEGVIEQAILVDGPCKTYTEAAKSSPLVKLINV